jgi:hypothetical protein
MALGLLPLVTCNGICIPKAYWPKEDGPVLLTVWVIRVSLTCTTIPTLKGLGEQGPHWQLLVLKHATENHCSSC